MIPYFSIKDIELRYSPPSRRLDGVFFDSQSRRIDDADETESFTFIFQVSYHAFDEDEDEPSYDKEDAFDVLREEIEEAITTFSYLNPLSEEEAVTALVSGSQYSFQAEIGIQKGVVRKYLDSGDINDYDAECFLLGLLFGPPDTEETFNDTVYTEWIFYFSDRNHTLRLHVSDTIPTSRDQLYYLSVLRGLE